MGYRSREPRGSTVRPGRLGLGLFLIGLCGANHACTSAIAESTTRTDAVPARPAATAVSTPAPRAPVQSQPAASAERGVFYDLAQHLAHAELRVEDTLVMNFGEPGDEKYTLGGWGTRMRRGVDLEGTSAALVRGSYGDVLIPLHHDGALVIDLRVRAPRDGDLTVYWDDHVLARVKKPATEFATLRVEPPAAKCTPGEHMLRVRGSGMGRVGVHSTAVAIDWVSVGKSARDLEAPPSAATLNPEPGKLHIPSGYSLGYAFKVPTGARLSTQLAGGQGKLSVQATGDDLKTVALGEYGPGKVDLDLSALEGKVIRLDLTAAGELTLNGARVTTPRTRPVAAPKPIRNVLVYLVDTLRADHLKPFNQSTRVKTPALDELVAKGSVLFASAHTQENWTKPSVATLLSSLLPWEHHAVTTEAVVPAGVEMLPEMLQDKGFYTGAFIANGYVSDKFGFKQGWDTWRNYIREGRPSRAQFLAADVLEWLDKRNQKLPFFLYVHAIDPHVPYKPTAEFLSVYDPMPYQGVVNFAGDSELLEKIKCGDIKLNARDKVHLEALYDSEISYHDVHFRSILSALDKRGLSDDTMIVMVADHGEEFWDHGSVGHGHSVYEELLHIPMLVRIPGVTNQTVRVTSSSGLVDILPTVLEALGEPVPAGISGHSLMPELTGQGTSAPRVTVSGFMDGWRTAVIGDLKLIQRTEKRVMLHELASDPHEQTDVASARPISTRYLRGQLGLALATSEQSEDAPVAGKKIIRQEKTNIDKETEAQLRALGYVGSSRR